MTLNLSGGALINRGLVITNNGYFSSGALSNGGGSTGNLVILGTVDSFIPITQSNIYIGTGSNVGNLTISNDLVANVSVEASSSLTGTSSNIVNLISYGSINPGFSDTILGQLFVTGSSSLNSGNLAIQLDGTNTDLLATGGKLIIGSSAVLDLSGVNLPVGALTNYTIATYGTHTGTFSTVNYPTGWGGSFNLTYNANDLVLSANIGAPGVVTWIGAVSGEWNTAGNWNGPQVPNYGDDVTFSTQGLDAGTITIVGTSGFANSLSFGPSSNPFTFTSGTIFLNGSVQPVISGDGEQSFSDVYLLQSGTISTTGSFIFNNLAMDSPLAKTLVLTGEGSYEVTGNFGDSIGLIELSSVNLTNSGTIGHNSGTVNLTQATITNSGNIGDSIGLIELSSVNLTNSGTIGHNSGTVNLTQATITNSGNIGPNATDIIINGGNITLAAPSNIGANSGTVDIQFITLENPSGASIANGATNFFLSNYAIVYNSGVIAETAAGINIASAFLINNLGGTVAYNAGSTTLGNAGIVLNSGDFASGTLSHVYLGGGAFGSSFSNASTGNVAQNAPIVSINTQLNNLGTVAYNAGSTTQIGGVIDNTGNFASGTLSHVSFAGLQIKNNSGGIIAEKAAVVNISNILKNYAGGIVAFNAGSTTLTTSADLKNGGNFASGTLSHVYFTAGQGHNYSGGVIANAAAVVTISTTLTNDTYGIVAYNAGLTTVQTGAVVSNSGDFGSGTSSNLFFTGGMVDNLGTMAESAKVLISTGAIITNEPYASFGVNASITINGGSITNLANFAIGEEVTLTLSGGNFYNNGIVADGIIAGPTPIPIPPLGFKETAKKSRLNATKPSLLQKLPQELSYLPMYGIINQLQNTSDASIKKVIDAFFALPNEKKMQALKELAPAFKLAQYSLEKLDLLIHKELETSLYTEQDGIRPFLMAGYDNLSQSAWDSYQGYKVNSFYQFVGLSGDYKKIKILGALGTSQSFMTLDTNSANASYYTAYAAFGLSSGHKRWHYGIDGLFGYSFFYGNRSLALLNETATTDHNLYNISVDSKLSYEFTAGNNSFSAYEQLGYIYGQEQAYQESGASGANLTVNGENISVIRNGLGFVIDTKIKSWETQTAHKKRHDFHQNGTQISFDEETVSMHKDEIRVFLDGSWVYDYYLNTNNFQASLTGTNVYTTVNLGVPIQNYGRVRAGFKGTHKKYHWQLAYTGLFGKNYIENSASLFLGRKF